MTGITRILIKGCWLILIYGLRGDLVGHRHDVVHRPHNAGNQCIQVSACPQRQIAEPAGPSCFAQQAALEHLTAPIGAS